MTGAPRVVALGGGHGLAASLRALRTLTTDLTAIVGVGDDGGSSGRLRSELNVLPPGDMRMALAALCGDDAWGQTWSRVVQHRFAGEGDLAGHAVGNLLIAALWEETGDLVTGLEWAAALLRTSGRVLPAATEPVELIAQVQGGDGLEEVRGQVAVATSAHPVRSLRLQPERPRACPQAVTAVLDADLIVLGPGSWFTSVLPHLLVPELAAAVRDARAPRVLVLNLSAQPGETSGFSAVQHLDVLRAHAPDVALDAVIVDQAFAGDADALASRYPGSRVHVADLRDPREPAHHDTGALSEAIRTVAEALTPTRTLPPWR